MAKYTIEQLRLLYFLSNNMDEDEFEECYGNVNFSRLEKLMAETSPVFETEVIDPTFEVEPDEPAELKYEIENVYDGMSMEQLVQFFKDKETFYSLRNCELELIAQEIAKHVKRSFGLNEEVDICVYNMSPKIYRQQVFGSTTDSESFTIYKITEKQLNREDNFVAPNTVGLSYLDTIIHETVHACQFEILKDFLLGNVSADKRRNYMNAEYILRAVIEETNPNVFKQENDTYFNQTWEFEARQIARDMVIDLHKKGVLAGENVRDFILFNYGCEVENMNFKQDYQREQVKEAVLFSKLKEYFNATFKAEEICPILLEQINQTEFVDYINYVNQTFNNVRNAAGSFWKEHIEDMQRAKEDGAKIERYKTQLAANEFSNLHKMYVADRAFKQVTALRGVNLYAHKKSITLPKVKIDMSKFNEEVKITQSKEREK